jgi:hypothetical protein
MGGPSRHAPPRVVRVRFALAEQLDVRELGLVHVQAGEGGVSFGQRLRKLQGSALCRPRIARLVSDRTRADFQAHPCTRCSMLLARLLTSGVVVLDEPILRPPWAWVRDGVHAEDGCGWVLTRARLDWRGEWRLHREAGRFRDARGRFTSYAADPDGVIDGPVYSGSLEALLTRYLTLPRSAQLTLFGETHAPEADRP